MGVRRDGRVAAVQVLYQLDLRNQPQALEQALTLYFAQVEPPLAEEAMVYAAQLSRGVIERQDEIDRLIEKASSNWKMSRMALVDRNIMRLATFELLADPSVPPTVVLDEAVEIAKDYGATESKAFVNGVLERVWDQLGSRPRRSTS